MKFTGDRLQRALSFVYRSLLICLIMTGLVLTVGTIYGVFFRSGSRNTQGGVQGNAQGQSNISQSGQGQTFTGIGRIRASTADPEPGMVILFVSFIYYPDDKAFSEELALKIRGFREIIVDYIGSFSGADLHTKNEESIKTELLLRFNAILRLGQIEALFFSDFMIVY